MIPLPSELAVVVLNTVFGSAEEIPAAIVSVVAGAGQGPAQEHRSQVVGAGPLAGNPPDVCPDCNGVGVLTLPDPFYGDYLDVACVCPLARQWEPPLTAAVPRPVDGAVEGPTPPASIVAVDSLCVPARTLAGDYTSHP